MQWFKHDSSASTDAKIRKLILRHGPTGYAVYFHCIELIVAKITSDRITFELEHDAEVIADNLKVEGTAGRSAVDIVNDIMHTIIDLDLFQESGDIITCMKIATRLENSIVKNPQLQVIQKKLKEENPGKSGKIRENPGQIRLDKIRVEQITDKDIPPKKPAEPLPGNSQPILDTSKTKDALWNAWQVAYSQAYGVPYKATAADWKQIHARGILDMDADRLVRLVSAWFGVPEKERVYFPPKLASFATGWERAETLAKSTKSSKDVFNKVSGWEGK
jgi:hypothetical protein